MKRESLSGLLLIACAILAMVISNSPFGPVYDHWLQAPLPAGTHMSLLHWINDAVMAVFFFVVGAEVKREFLYGELKSRSAAMLPMAAALGGMLVPAAIYSVFNAGLPTAGGWGIPMATDIAFSLGGWPVRDDIEPAEGSVDYSEINVAPFDANEIYVNYNTVRDFWQMLG